ncbi:MAG: protein kinase domain-containing protein, partial [Planctomycetota bacterium]
MPESQLGPYRLLAELGSGGMGTVHAAEVAKAVPGLEVGQKVAIKIIHPHLLSSPGFFKRFLREGELGRKVVHENVVRTFDVDATEMDDKIVHYMVMEYVEGKSLRQLLHDLRTIPETLLREIASQTSAGLAAIHAHGIVHRDLKPENVLITDDQEIRIMDLGVAKLQETSIAITQEGQFAGSILYAAPEQFGPSGIGPAVDQYALGVMLHELSTGDNPFRRDDAAGVIDAQLNLEPRRLTDICQETTAFFAQLVATLLEKDPERRFASAEVLCDVLSEAERSEWWRALEPKLREEVAHLPKIRVRRETEPHGMDADLALLREAWDKAKAGEGNTVYVEGEAGIGKTRLLDAFLQGLGERDIHVLYGSYPPSGGLGGVSDAILEKFGETTLDRGLRPYLTVTPSLVPAFAALMKRESPPAGSEPLQGEALHAVMVHLMRGLAEERPLIWLIEDLHFAPKESRDSTLALARAAAGHRVLLVFTARPGVPGDELANFSRLANHQRLSLRRLGAREVAELLEDAFKSEALAEKLGIRIAKKSDGVPFFILEMIRGLKEGNFIRQQPDGSYVQTQMITDIEVPSKVKDLIEGRLRGLSEEQRAVLDVGAVEGLVFDPGLVAAVLEEKRVRVLRHLAEIQRRSGLVVDEEIQEVLYQDLPTHLRAEYHTLLAEAHAARLEGEPAGEDAVFLATHHLHGSRPQAGLPHLTPALERLERCYRTEAALDLADRALQTPRLLEGAARVEVLLRKAGRHDLRGERGRERAVLDEAVALADDVGDAGLRAKASIALGRYLFEVSSFEDARARFEQALALGVEDRELEAAARNGVGLALWSLGRYDEAQQQLEQSLALARAIDDRQGAILTHVNLGVLAQDLGRHEDGRAHFEKCLALSREIGEQRGEVLAAGNLGAVLSHVGHYEEA